MLTAHRAVARSAGRLVAASASRSFAPFAISARVCGPAARPVASRGLAMPAWTKHYDVFERRHNGPSTSEEQEMLKVVGVKSIEELLEQTIPSNIRSQKQLKVGEALSEIEALSRLQDIVSTNKVLKSYIGMGYYNTITPPTILRNIIQNPGWYTPYTPYQAEISQGRMESLVNYQTMDEGTAAAEAMAMCQTICKSKKSKFFISSLCNPQTIEVCKVRAEPIGVEVIVGDPNTAKFDATFMGILIPYPTTDGRILDYSSVISAAKTSKIPTVFVADLLSLTILKPPGELGADIVVGNSQRFGVPLGYGGPHAAFLSCKDEHKRAVPGRMIGESRDVNGGKAYRLALQAREQHIRREKANSNICTAQALLSNTAAMYAVYHGPGGLSKIALRVNGLTKTFAAGVKAQGYAVPAEPFFDTVRVEVSDAAAVLKTAVEQGCNLRQLSPKAVTVSLDETTTDKDVETLLAIFGKHAKGKAPSVEALAGGVTPGFEGALKRTSKFMTQDVFTSYHTETDMMRYMFKLQTKDLGLNSSIIPLGSCTMKLNATAEMIPVTWPEINNIHPFVPVDQVPGYQAMLQELGEWLIDITGFDAITLQPNAGASGEYAGLMCIREYHKHRGDTKRNVCLIPRAAHGTNPATAAMCGMDVVPIECDDAGNTDMKDLAEKAAKHKNELAALMITYPSTHGVFEDTIVEICKIVHDNGGLVYMDGANMNAQVGFTSPGRIGADVCHLNLHKTFCIPHGGGGPGMGPIGVNNKLAPFLPGHPVVKTGGDKAIGPIAAAPWGSASILPISWMYIQMMGTRGLERATELAILNANYMAERLKGHYDLLFTGSKGRIAHEFILDLRPFKDRCGIDAVDIAKRLLDYGLHAPTMSWPVVGTLMCEPTESESKGELDRFVEALISIREEIREVETGKADKVNNLLKNAPHTMEEIASTNWSHPYPRDRAAYPVPGLRKYKFWPTVKRVDDVWGDKNLIIKHPPKA